VVLLGQTLGVKTLGVKTFGFKILGVDCGLRVPPDGA
jgi:hypothetical protein